MMDNWVINEEQAKKIIETKPIKAPESKVFNDIHLPKEERIKHAKKVLEKWKSERVVE